MKRECEDSVRLLREMCSGSTTAFDRFYSHYAPLVMRIAVRMLGDRMEAEDICHDIFLEVLRKGDKYEVSRGSIEAWLAVMTRSRCLDRARRMQKVIVDRVSEHMEMRGQMTDSSAHTEDEVISKLQRDALLEEMESLPPVQQKAVTAAFFSQKSHRELAKDWNVPLGTVKSWIRYGLSKLRSQLEHRGWVQESEGGTGRESS